LFTAPPLRALKKRLLSRSTSVASMDPRRMRARFISGTAFS
jgi:hypothetical protein